MFPLNATTVCKEWVSRHYITTSSLIAVLSGLLFIVINYLHEPQYLSPLQWKTAGGILLASIIIILAYEALFIIVPAIQLVKEAEAANEEARKLKSQFLANMSHEIRTPMNAIFGMAELLMQSSLTPRQKGYVKALLHGADNLMNTLDDILDLSRIETGRLQLNPIVFDLREAAEDVMEMLSPLAHEKQLDLILEAPPPDTRIVADRGRMRQVLYHLVENAIKFTSSGHVLMRITLKQENEKAAVECVVEDTGIGIASNRIAMIFEPFVQEDGTPTRPHEGAGLGLSLCKRLVELMNGSIEIESKQGSGSHVRFNIGCDLAYSASKPSSRTILRNKHVLVVDDIAANRNMLAEHLKQVGMSCDLATSGTEGLRLARRAAAQKKPYDIVITDYLMPEMDGETLTRAIHASPQLSLMPVVVLTSAGEKGYTKLFSDAGAAACLSKPVRSSELLETLVLVIEAKHREGMLTSGSGNRMAAKELVQSTAPFHHVKVLLVEDNRINREYATELMASQGCEIVCAENGVIALEKIQQASFDIVFMDCQMPVMDGFEASKAITGLISEKKIAPLPVIALTANAMQGDRERCLKAGMSDFMHKPLRKPNWEAIMIKWLKHKLSSQNPEHTSPINAFPAIKDVSTPAQAKPSPSALPGMLDEIILQDAKQTMGNKFSTVLRYYLEDTETYLLQLEEAARNGDAREVSVQAHSIKSSSRQFGVLQVSAAAEVIELATRNGDVPGDVRAKLADLRTAFDRSRPHLQQMAEAA